MIPNDTPIAAKTVAAQADSGPPAVRHPEWCHTDRCTATPAAAVGEAHRGEPVTITLDGLYSLTVAASLYKPHARWLTEVYIELDIAGLDDGWRPVRGTATMPAHRAGEIGRALLDLAARGSADQRQEIDEHLVTLRTEAAR
jgi:hypothetical protein